ncbi:hypothetical protein [Azospirillum sp. sgz302134]
MISSDQIATLVQRFFAGDDPARVLSDVGRLGPAAATVFGFSVSSRLHKIEPDPNRRDLDAQIICARAGVDYAALCTSIDI